MEEIQKEMWRDMFQEMGNVGTGAAVTALSDIMGRGIAETMPQVMELKDGQILDTFEKVEESIIGVLFPFGGEIEGMFLLTYDEPCVSRFLKRVLNLEADFAHMDEERLAVIKEMANLMASSYFTAISAYTNLRIELSVPAVSVDMAGAMILDTASWFFLDGEDVVSIKSSFAVEGSEGNNHMILMLCQKSAKRFLDALGGLI